ALHRHVGRLVHAGDLHHRVLTAVAGAVLGDGDLHADAGQFLEAGGGPLGLPVADIDEEVELDVGSVAQDGHRDAPQILRSAVHWPMRKMTNSAGRSGATPTRQTSRPLSRSFCDMVERSHLTK